MDNSSKVEMDYKQDSHYEETVMMKSPKTYEEQVKIIKKKGFIVDDDEACEWECPKVCVNLQTDVR